MMVWQMIFLFQGCILRFYVNLKKGVWVGVSATKERRGLQIGHEFLCDYAKIYFETLHGI